MYHIVIHYLDGSSFVDVTDTEEQMLSTVAEHHNGQRLYGCPPTIDHIRVFKGTEVKVCIVPRTGVDVYIEEGWYGSEEEAK